MRSLAITLLTLGASAVAFASYQTYTTPAVVPEVDPGYAAGALALISGAFLVVKNARRK